MKIVIAGGSGFLGSALSDALKSRGDTVVVLSRRGATPWTPDGTIGPWAAHLDGADAIVNLAGEPLPDKRWTADQKTRILQSRVLATRSLVEAIRASSRRPSIFISGSGVGIYPDAEEPVDESSPPGSGFLARVCVAWESEALRADGPSCRVVLLRTGVVLHRSGGAIRKLILPFSLGAGGPIGSGAQWWGWIHLEDWVRMTIWALDTERLRGPLNVCAPEPERNRDIMKALGRSLHRPAVIPAPAFALRIALGDMAGEMLLASQRAVPRVARDGGFAWMFPALQPAMDDAVRPVPR